MQHKQTAMGLASLGRGPDTELVHMTKGEIHGLQRLAVSQGGTLTINPETGLVEAGFLSSLLPMVIGAGITYFSGGTLGPMAAAMMTGAGYTAATGSLKKGLMAGLGAYGGAGIAGSLAGTGATAAAEGAMAAGAGAAPITTAAEAGMAGVQGAGTNMAGFQTAGAGLQSAATAFPGAAAGAGPLVTGPTGGFTASSIFPTTTVGAAPITIGPTGVPVTTAAQLGPTNAAAANMPSAWENIKAGAGKAFGSTEGLGQFYEANKYPLMAGGISLLGGMGQEKANTPETNPGMIRPYTFTRTQQAPTDALGSLYTPGQSTRERQWFEDSYAAGTPYRAPGPEYLAAGGPVEDMSNANVLGQNTGYPMANIQSGNYATPLQRPINQNVVTGPQDAATNPYTGQATFAEGGEVYGSAGGYNYDPATGLYTKLNGQGATTVRPAQYENGSVGGYTFDPLTGTYGRSPTMALSPAAQALYAPYGDGGSDGGGFGVNGGYMGNSDSLSNGLVGAMFGQDNLAPVDYSHDTGLADNNGGHGDNGGNAAASDSSGGTASGAGNVGGGWAAGGITALAQGGSSNLGGYSDGGQLLRGPGDGVSDSIPAMIGQKQHARLADGEFVVPARIVSELGNGSTEAGSRQLYAMMDRIQKARKKSIGKDKVATNSRAAKLLPA